MDYMEHKRHIKLMHAESGMRMEFAVQAEIQLGDRRFLVLAPDPPAPSKEWSALMEDPDMAFCVLEQAEKPDLGTIFLPVSDDCLREVFQIFKARHMEADPSCQRPARQV